MLIMFDKELLQGQSCCEYTGLETQKPHAFGKALRIFICKSTGVVRLLAYNDLNQAVSGLIIDPDGQKRTYTIKGIFTLDTYRRKGYAKQLLAVSRMLIGTVKHSDLLTIEGEKWRDSVEMLNKQ